MADQLFIVELISKIQQGSIRIPNFQRGFVWDADKICHLMDSLYKGFPFGSLLFWRTRTPLSTEKNLGPFPLPQKEPDYPIDYILDGQQRATSIFGVFQNSISPRSDASVFDIYFDLEAEAEIQESNFVCISSEEFNPTRYFPLRLLFNPPEYRKFLKETPEEIAQRVDTLFQKFNTARIPVQTFETDDRAAVAIVFERINRLGVELDTLQLLCAWTWSEEFNLQDQFLDLAEDLETYGFRGVGEDSDLLLRCCAAIISGEASPNALVTLAGGEVRERFAEIKKGILGAIDFLKTHINVHSLQVLPFPSVIIPLSVYFATDRDQDTHPSEGDLQILIHWVWRTFFTRRYSKRLEQLNSDIKEIKKLKSNQKSNLGNFQVNVGENFFYESSFNLNTANTKTFILLLAANKPLNFTNGGVVALDQVLRSCNKKEFHHVYPKRFLLEQTVPTKDINCLYNFVILSKADNNALSGDAPSSYRNKMPNDADKLTEILSHSLCPQDIFHDNYDRFKKDRLPILLKKAQTLMGVSDH